MMNLKDFGIDPKKQTSELMTKKVDYSYTNDSIKQVSEKIIDHGHRRLPIVRIKKIFSDKIRELAGIITVMDILEAYIHGVCMDDPIEKIMHSEVIFCYPEETLNNLIRKFKISRRGGFPVVDKKRRLVGIITEHDIIKLFDNKEFNIPVSKIMTQKPFFLRPDKLFNSMKILVNVKYRKLPIVDNNKVVGLLTERLCLKTLVDKNFERSKLNMLNIDVSIRDIIYVSSNDDVSEVIKLMLKYRIGGIPVIDDGRLVGFVTERNILERL